MLFGRDNEAVRCSLFLVQDTAGRGGCSSLYLIPQAEAVMIPLVHDWSPQVEAVGKCGATGHGTQRYTRNPNTGFVYRWCRSFLWLWFRQPQSVKHHKARASAI